MDRYVGSVLPRRTPRARTLERRAVVLVASADPAFEARVGPMLAAQGFDVAHAPHWEAGWLAVTRTQPAAVLCDLGEPGAHVRPIVAECVARGLPLLLAHPDPAGCAERATMRPTQRAAEWLASPVAPDALRGALDALGLPSEPAGRRLLSLVPRSVPRSVLPRAARTAADSPALAIQPQHPTEDHDHANE